MLEGVGPSVALGRDTTLLREILDKTAKDLGNALTNQPEVELELRSILANTYHELDLYHPMEAMARRCLELARSVPGGADEYVTDSLNSLGDALMHLGNLDEAEKCTREALAMSGKRQGDEYRAYAVRSHSILGQILEKRGNLAEAETTFRESLALAKNLPGNKDSEVAPALYDLANVLDHQSKLPEAESLFREELMIERKLHGDQHPGVAHTLNNLGKVLWQQGKLAEAETLFRQVLAMSRKLMGNEHPLVATSLQNLGRVLADLGQWPEAETMLREALRMRRRLFGNDDPILDAPLNNLARVLLAEGEWQESEALNRELLALRRKQAGGQLSDVADTLEILSSALEGQGEQAEAETTQREAEAIRSKLAEAERLQRDALAMRRKLVGNEHPDVVGSLENLAVVLEDEGKFAEAESAYREALSILAKLPGEPAAPENLHRAKSLHHLAEVSRKQKSLAQARSLAEESFACYRLHPDWPANERQHALEVLTRVLVELDNLTALEALYRDELAHFQTQASNSPSSEVSERGVLLHHLAEVLRERKALAEARALAEEAAALYRLHPDWPSDEREHALEVLGAVLTDLGDLPASEVTCRERLELVRALVPCDNPDLAMVVAELTALLLQEKKFAEAEPLARECLAVRQKRLPDDWRTFNARALLGGALLGQKKYGEETERMLLSGYEGLKHREEKIPTEGRKNLKEALQRLARYYRETNRPDQAARWQQPLDEFDHNAK